jgi:hypothetical protein
MMYKRLGSSKVGTFGLPLAKRAHALCSAASRTLVLCADPIINKQYPFGE